MQTGGSSVICFLRHKTSLKIFLNTRRLTGTYPNDFWSQGKWWTNGLPAQYPLCLPCEGSHNELVVISLGGADWIPATEQQVQHEMCKSAKCTNLSRRSLDPCCKRLPSSQQHCRNSYFSTPSIFLVPTDIAQQLTCAGIFIIQVLLLSLLFLARLLLSFHQQKCLKPLRGSLLHAPVRYLICHCLDIS